ncbi:MAG: glycosyltransferase family 4 protein, partial [Leptolyngbya sp. SIO1D8]|nr:glycosyltransferase family 4 protein [Leptolyngbya sp. SIO1D8]
AMGLPVVTTDIRGCREAVKPGLNGSIVPPRDSKQLANALAALLADPLLCQQLGEASRVRVEAEFDERLVFQRLANAYCDLGIVLPEPTSKGSIPISVGAIPATAPSSIGET